MVYVFIILIFTTQRDFEKLLNLSRTYPFSFLCSCSVVVVQMFTKVIQTDKICRLNNFWRFDENLKFYLLFKCPFRIEDKQLPTISVSLQICYCLLRLSASYRKLETKYRLLERYKPWLFLDKIWLFVLNVFNYSIYE